MKKISIYIRARDVSPSGYYRILQYTQKLEGRCWVHNVLPPCYYRWYLAAKHKIRFPLLLDAFTYMLMYIRCLMFLLSDYVKEVDVVVVSRGLLPKYFLFPLSAVLKKLLHQSEKLIWDFDDDILLSGEISEREYLFLSENSDAIFVTHQYLADKVDSVYRNKVMILPTTDGDFSDIDIRALLSVRKNTFGRELKLVWTGSAVNLIHLEAAIPALDSCAQTYMKRWGRKIILNVCCSEPLVCSTRFLIVNKVLWTREAAVELIKYSHIGIMPLLPSQYSLGKGGFKLIQYMAAGLPIIGSDVGFNQSIITNKNGCLIHDIGNQSEWMNALNLFGVDFQSYCDAAVCSLQEWEKHYPAKNNLELWSKAIGVPVQ